MKILSSFSGKSKSNCFFNLGDFQEEINLVSKTGEVRISSGNFTPSIVLYACIHDAVLLILSLFSEIRLNVSPSGNRGAKKSCVTDGKMRLNSLVTPSSIIHGVCSRARRWTQISRDLLQWLNHKVTASSFLSVTITICCLWCREPPVVCLMLRLTLFGGNMVLFKLFILFIEAIQLCKS